MGKYFGTDGFRGEANVVLTVEHAYKVGRYLGYYFGKDKTGEGDDRARIVIGKDTRRSSYMFEYSLVAGLTASGADVFLMHVTPTRSVSYIVRTDEFDCGIMISASHNPFYDNGIKIINNHGAKIDASVEEEIEKYIDGEIPELPLATKEKIGRTTDYSMGRNRYIGYLMTLPTRSFKNIKVGLDCANGASFTVAKPVFDALGAKTYVINADPDGTNINTDCGSTHIEGLQKFVVENGLDCGFAYDGDADRCLAVDEKGNLIDGDAIMYICGKYMKQKGQLVGNKVVTTVMSNMGLYKALEAADIGYEQTAVGDKYVYENMMENGYVLGGEQSGHIIFSKNSQTGDGVLTSLKLMEVKVENKCAMSELTRGLRIYPQVLVNVRVKDQEAALNDPDVLLAKKAVEEKLGGNGRILLRKSGTEPLARVMVEAETDELCRECAESVANVIREKGYEI